MYTFVFFCIISKYLSNELKMKVSGEILASMMDRIDDKWGHVALTYQAINFIQRPSPFNNSAELSYEL